MLDRRNRNTTLASALVSELQRAGVRDAVISPGSRSTPISLALEAADRIRTHVVLDERSAGFVALGLALASGRPSAVSCTSGSAAANLHPAVVEADEASVPLLLLTSDRPPELRGIGAGQAIDQIGLYGSAVRWFCEVGTHDADDTGVLHYRTVGARSVAESLTPRPGPVHLNLSWRDPLGPEPHPESVALSDEVALSGHEPRPLTQVHVGDEPTPAALDAIAGGLRGLERGLIVAGRQLDADLAPLVAELAAAAGLPILAEPDSQLRFGDHRSELQIDHYDSIIRAGAPALAPDFVIRFGDMPTSKGLRKWLAGLDQLSQVVVDPPGRWDDPTRKAGSIVRADPRSVARGLAARLRPCDRAWARSWQRAEKLAAEAIDAALPDALSEPLVHRRLADLFASGESVMVASSMPIRDHEAFAAGTGADVRFFANRGANGIDGLISTAAGIAAAGPGPVWLVLGDLAFAHDLGGLAAAAELPGELRIVVIDNGGGGIFDFLPQAGQLPEAEFERLFTTPSRLDLEAAAATFGIDYLEIERPADLEQVASSETLIAHIRTDRSHNVELHRELAAAVATALGSAGDQG